MKQFTYFLSITVLVAVFVLVGGHKIEARDLKNKMNELQELEMSSNNGEGYVYAAAAGYRNYPYVYYYPYYKNELKNNKPVVAEIINNTKTLKFEDGKKIQLKSYEEIKDGLIIDKNLSSRVAGKILLQTEEKGAIWYVDKQENKRHQVNWETAMPLFEKYSLGINNKDLAKIPASVKDIDSSLDSDGDGFPDVVEIRNSFNPYDSNPVRIKTDANLSNRLSGRFLLQVENGGAIWYVDDLGTRHLIKRDNLQSAFERLSLGVTNSDLYKIEDE